MHTSKLRVPIYYQFGNHKVPTTCHQNQQQTWKRNSCVSEWCRANVKSHAGKKCRKRIQQQISLKILKLAFKTVGNSSQGYNHQPLSKGLRGSRRLQLMYQPSSSVPSSLPNSIDSFSCAFVHLQFTQRFLRPLLGGSFNSETSDELDRWVVIKCQDVG